MIFGNLLKYFRLLLVTLLFFGGSTVFLVLIWLGAGGDDPAYFYSHSLNPVLRRILGIRLEIRNPEHLRSSLPVVFVANHQSSFDLFIHGCVFPEGTITIGKRSLLLIPIFGWIFVACKCILIDRKKHDSAIASMKQAAEEMLKRQRSVFIFAEGTRSGKRGLLPFKSGAFHLAINAQRPVVPLVASAYYLSFDIRKWNAGTVVVQCLPPLSTKNLKSENVPALVAQVHLDVAQTLAKLNAEMSLRKAGGAG